MQKSKSLQTTREQEEVLDLTAACCTQCMPLYSGNWKKNEWLQRQVWIIGGVRSKFPVKLQQGPTNLLRHKYSGLRKQTWHLRPRVSVQGEEVEGRCVPCAGRDGGCWGAAWVWAGWEPPGTATTLAVTPACRAHKTAVLQWYNVPVRAF